jgi:hypothetical protein
MGCRLLLPYRIVEGFARQLLRIDAAHALSAMVEADELREPPRTALRYRRTNLESAQSRSGWTRSKA